MKFFCGMMGLAWALGCGSALAAGQAFGEAASSVPAIVDKCPMHNVHTPASHKPDAPCPVGEGKTAMHDKCDLHSNKDGKGKAGEPCPLPHDAKCRGKAAEACDPASHGKRSAK